jgi:hypothetical protein
MKLDEWIDGGEVDDISEDFMFRPQLIEEQSTEPERSMGRRRRRRRPERDGAEDTGRRFEGEKTAFAEAEVGMNVVFRQRK